MIIQADYENHSLLFCVPNTVQSHQYNVIIERKSNIRNENLLCGQCTKNSALLLV